MRAICLALLGCAGIGCFGLWGASAAPANGTRIAQLAHETSHVTDVAGGVDVATTEGRGGAASPIVSD